MDEIKYTKLTTEQISERWNDFSEALLTFQTIPLEMIKRKWVDICSRSLENVVFKFQIVDAEIISMFTGDNAEWIRYQNIVSPKVSINSQINQINRLFNSGLFATVNNEQDTWKYLFIRASDFHRLLNEQVPSFWWEMTWRKTFGAINRYGATRKEWDALFLHSSAWGPFRSKNFECEPWPLDLWMRFSHPEIYISKILSSLSFKTLEMFQKFVDFEYFFKFIPHCSKKMVATFATTPRLKKIVKDRVLNFTIETNECPDIDLNEPLSIFDQAYFALPDTIPLTHELKNIPFFSFLFVLKMITYHHQIKFFAAQMFWDEIELFVGWAFILKYCSCSTMLIEAIFAANCSIEIRDFATIYQKIPESFLIKYSLSLKLYLQHQTVSDCLFDQWRHSYWQELYSNPKSNIPISVWNECFDNEEKCQLLVKNHDPPPTIYFNIPLKYIRIFLLYHQFPQDILEQVLQLPIPALNFNYQELTVEMIKKYQTKLSSTYFLFHPLLYSLTKNQLDLKIYLLPWYFSFADNDTFANHRVDDMAFVDRFFVPQQHAQKFWANPFVDVSFKAKVAARFNLYGSDLSPTDPTILYFLARNKSLD